MQIARWFVGKNHFGLRYHRPRNAHQLLLPARKLGGKKVFFGYNIEPVQNIGHAAFALRRAHSFVKQRRFDVFINRQFVNEMVCLKHKADVVAVEFGAFFFG